MNSEHPWRVTLNRKSRLNRNVFLSHRNNIYLLTLQQKDTIFNLGLHTNYANPRKKGFNSIIMVFPKYFKSCNYNLFQL